MADGERSKGGGSKKIGRDKEKCKRWRSIKDPRSGDRHKITGSHEHRNCGPLGYYLRFLAARPRTSHES
jgi:hypothetical protein